MRERLSRSDWIRHGLRTLTRDGPSALKVEPMAQALGVSRGSFYWHFADLADFKRRLPEAWARSSTDRIIEGLDARPGDTARLRELLEGGFRGRRRLDSAVRAWAHHDPVVAEVVAGVDARRIGRVAGLIAEAGVEPEQARRRAVFLYWAYLGQAAVMDPAAASLPAGALAEIADLFEA
jgi:AcrR family transcriptional regulator